VLPARYWHVIRMRYLEGMTLEETGQALKPPVTRERVRQIELKAFATLRRHYPHGKGL
jgi:RNA polymerase sigma factor (sigma-70 family)